MSRGGRRGNRRGNGGGRRRIMDVRMVPENEGNRAEKVERMIAAYKESQAITRVIIRAQIGLNTVTTTLVGAWSFANVKGLPDFEAMAGLYESYKVAGIRFDIFDQNPSVTSNSLFATFHQRGTGGGPNSYAQVADSPDVTEVAPGTGKKSLYWYPSGPLEHSYSGTSSSDNTDYGGLVFALPAVSSSAAKYSVLAAFVIDFRARV